MLFDSVVLEYSTDHGENWFTLYEACLTRTCTNFIPLSTVYTDRNYFSR